MFRILFLLFLAIPLIEIAVFIQVGDLIGLLPTVLGVVLTAVIGIHLLREQGLTAWREIQQKLSSGALPAVEMASAAQLLVAGALLLTPGFVTDGIGFALLVPQVRRHISHYLFRYWQQQQTASTSFYYASWQTTDEAEKPGHHSHHPFRNRVIEGEVEKDEH